ncbi:peptidoglycan DD-metalloendopeptidase family protein [Rhodobacter sp. NTK016B]|uniref:peptidoglycan DD-metalloendopeptidase family protein n=1 Tax=Rhodobacter sp. NTK016B TaxID=2759676 RepID=UPI001A8D9B96|nr:peptidoglycan DD-metalloendopeptidase family protein [Rhodobacter sp. NTK016B]MBN8294481.1 peptidoglycan DD-metalloendopeptidase family protein [Rhodobacter sp. NTK016B]
MGGLLLAGGVILAGCSGGNDLDWDMRPSSRFNTADAAQSASTARPAPDSRGVISYPGYQVVVAQQGERVSDIALRLGVDANALAQHNAVSTDTPMRGGELLVLPSRVGDSATGTITATPLAGADGAAPAANEPLRHTVERGESAFTIARLYNVSPRSLADWNGLPADMSVREGQILMIPTGVQTITAAAAGEPLNPTGISAPAPAAPTPGSAAQATADVASQPGQGTPTPVPPSAATPLPDSSPEPAGQAAAAAQPEAPVADMSSQRSTGSRLAMPVQGRIIRAYAQGRNDGIGIGAAAGTAVTAAASGTVAAITEDTDQVPIMVIRHENNLLTVYAGIDNIRVSRGDSVSRGQTIASVRAGDPSFLHFEVREGFESVDPMPYLQ